LIFFRGEAKENPLLRLAVGDAAPYALRLRMGDVGSSGGGFTDASADGPEDARDYCALLSSIHWLPG